MSRKLLDIEAGRRLVLERASPLSAEELRLDAALGRILAEDVASSEAIPPFDNSAMDGYAVRAADTAGAEPDAPVELRVVGESRAGAPATASAKASEAIGISTGAAMPSGCDAVVRLEEVEVRDGTIRVAAPVPPGRDVRRAGEDVGAGEAVLRRGTVLGASELGVLASVGRPLVSCSRPPRVGVLTTGDELVGPGNDLLPGKIRDANAHSVPALARTAGASVTVDHTSDDAVATRDAVSRLLSADVAVVCGGVSVGEHDHVRPAFAELGVEEVFWGLALRPGRPTWFGTAADGALAFGLPGNPVSAMVTFILLARPALLALQGASPELQRSTAVLEGGYPKQPGRAHAVRVRLEPRDDGWHAVPTKRAQASHVLTSMLGADALAIIPAERGDVAAGERVDVELLPPPLPLAPPPTPAPSP